jgi:nucleoside-diphosphate-sugar epimerase
MHTTRARVLLTGATGVIGQALVEDLAPDTTLLCVRRHRPVGDSRVRELTGDVTRPGLGLDAAARRLLHDLDAVVHCAAVTSFRAGAGQTHEANVQGTRHAAELAAGLGARFYHVSTAFVLRAGTAGGDGATAQPEGADRDGADRDGADRDGAGTDGVASPGAYLASKVAAERWLREHAPDSVIIRPALVAGDSQTGHIGQFQGIYQIFGGVAVNALPLLPVPATALVDFLPQDVVAAGIARLVRDGAVGGDYWLTAGRQALDIGELVTLAVRVGESFGHPVHRPRCVADGSMVDRLLMPLLDDVIPAALRRKFQEMLELVPLFRGDTPFPSSLADLGLADRVSRASLAESFTRSLRYWADVRGLAAQAA